ncbi:GntR family transcriptional regulator [Photobacterium marinum]|nr:GntR family transcriptional regulator [Photobacterium marinum]
MMKINKQSLEEQATEYLRHKIISGEMAQGEKIVESTLAKDLELSRSTIRMALNSLSHEGLVTLKPYAGWQVISLNEDDLWELYNLRVALESQAAAMAAEKASDQDKQNLRALYDDYCQLCEQNPTDIKAISDADFHLHRKIVEASKSMRMEKIYGQIANQLQSYLSMTHQNYDLSQSGLSHEAMINAICSGDPELASREAKANITPFTQLCSTLKQDEN